MKHSARHSVGKGSSRSMPGHFKFSRSHARSVERHSGSRAYLQHREETRGQWPRCQRLLMREPSVPAYFIEVEGGHDKTSKHRSFWTGRRADRTRFKRWLPLRQARSFVARRGSKVFRRHYCAPGDARGRCGIDCLLPRAQHHGRRRCSRKLCWCAVAVPVSPYEIARISAPPLAAGAVTLPRCCEGAEDVSELALRPWGFTGVERRKYRRLRASIPCPPPNGPLAAFALGDPWSLMAPTTIARMGRSSMPLTAPAAS
jgi:hypothetical protein